MVFNPFDYQKEEDKSQMSSLLCGMQRNKTREETASSEDKPLAFDYKIEMTKHWV